MRPPLPEDRRRRANDHIFGGQRYSVQTDGCHLEKKRNRDPLASRSLAAFARCVGHPKVIIGGESEHALMAVIHGACALLTSATPRTSLVNSKGSNGAAERAVQSVDGVARTLRFDLLSSTNVAVGRDLPITSWMVRHAGC